jgi:hypothetical protein
VHERDSHVHMMMMNLHGFFSIPQSLYSKIEDLTCMDIVIL